MLRRFIYNFLLVFFMMMLVFSILFPLIFVLQFIFVNLSDIDWLLTKESWGLLLQALMKEMPANFVMSIYIGIMSGAATVIVYLCNPSIVPDSRTRFFGLGILAVFMASLFFLAKYYGLIPLKNAFA